MGFSRQEYWSGVPLPSPIRSSKEDKIFKCNNDDEDDGSKQVYSTYHASTVLIILHTTQHPFAKGYGYYNSHLKVKVKSLSRVRLFATPQTVAYQAPPSMGFSRQEYWSGLPFPSPGDLPHPGIETGFPSL